MHELNTRRDPLVLAPESVVQQRDPHGLGRGEVDDPLTVQHSRCLDRLLDDRQRVLVDDADITQSASGAHERGRGIRPVGVVRPRRHGPHQQLRHHVRTDAGMGDQAPHRRAPDSATAVHLGLQIARACTLDREIADPVFPAVRPPHPFRQDRIRVVDHGKGIGNTLVERSRGPVQTQLIGLHPHAARHLPDERVAILVHDHIDVMAEVVPVIRDAEAEVPYTVVVEVTEECIGEREVGEHPDGFREVKAKVDVGPLGELVQVKVDLSLGERIVSLPFCWRVEIVSGRARLGLRCPLQARPIAKGPRIDAPGLTGADFAVDTGEVLVRVKTGQVHRDQVGLRRIWIVDPRARRPRLRLSVEHDSIVRIHPHAPRQPPLRDMKPPRQACSTCIGEQGQCSTANRVHTPARGHPTSSLALTNQRLSSP